LTKDGAPVFYREAAITDQHEQWLSEDYFCVVCQMRRNPRYTNKRIMDPQLKCFVDEQGYEVSPEWGLPVPNADASYKSLAKYGKAILPLTVEHVKAMNKAWEYTMRHFGLYMSNSRVLSYQEAKEHFDMSTSSGAPFNVHYPLKKDLFEKDPDIDAWLEQDFERMGIDPYWTCLYTNSLKEELRTAEKIGENSIRTFLSGGVDAVAHGTRLFVDMNEKMYASHLQSASVVGMSPYKGNWDRLYQKLKVFRKGYALDESQYDSSLRSYMMWGCAKFRWSMLRTEDRTKENWQRITTYYRNLINSLVICPDGVIIMKKTGNPSGSVNTITDNTLILYTLLAYSWIMLVPKELNSYEAFEMHTAKALVGDDNTWTVSDEAHPFFNARTVIEQWKVLGVTTTTDSLEPRTAKELDFLSAHTVFLKGLAVPLYARDKLMNSCLFAPREHITPSTTLERVAALLSVGWTDLPFRTFCREVIDWLLYKYDHILADDPKWILAKCQIQTDESYERLFLGKAFILSPQSMSGTRVKLIQPDKSVMSRAIPKGPGPTGKRGRGRRGPRGRKNVTRNQIREIMEAPKQQRRIPKRPNGGRRRPRGRGMLTGRGEPSNFPRAARTSTIQQSEYLQEINGSTGFAITTLPINPGQPITFPWLSIMAAQWEKYHFDYLEFFYKREVSEFATNGQSGKVMMYVDFDANDSPATTKQEVEDTDPHVDCMPCQNLSLKLPAKRIHSLYPTLFVRSGNLPGRADIKTFDAGTINIATSGCTNASVIGELHVRYKVTFSVPILNPALQQNGAQPSNFSTAMFSTGNSLAVTSGVATPLPWLGALPPFPTDPFGIAFAAGNTVLTPPAGNYICTYTMTGFLSGTVTAGDTLSTVCRFLYKGLVLPGVVDQQISPVVKITGITTSATLSCTAFLQFNGAETLSVNGTLTTTSTTAQLNWDGILVMQSV